MKEAFLLNCWTEPYLKHIWHISIHTHEETTKQTLFAEPLPLINIRMGQGQQQVKSSEIRLDQVRAWQGRANQSWAAGGKLEGS